MHIYISNINQRISDILEAYIQPIQDVMTYHHQKFRDIIVSDVGKTRDESAHWYSWGGIETT